ncbi:MAG: dNTP triphosphohydrolase [Clostridiales bacterium]|nr:dNTP triphosphohydrolase [Clostridiales bacterium]
MNSDTTGNNSSMSWSRLVSDKRFGLEEHIDNKGGTRSDFRRDYDRMVFSSPFRRLQNKTQVFPLPGGSIFVHNRLTHSLEVSSVGRSIATEVMTSLMPGCNNPEEAKALESIGEIVAAACLAHDLGNPPFGHSGEKAISTFFSEGNGAVLRGELTDAQWNDLVHFEGNANALRVLTHNFAGRRQGGFGMTYATLASIVKYPFESSLAGGNGKFGFFTTERDSFIKIADELGMIRIEHADAAVEYARHPLVYIVEAADDICYEIMDIEDAHKLKILPTTQVLALLLNYFEGEQLARHTDSIDTISDPNEKVAYLRSAVISRLVSCCADCFVENHDAIMQGRFTRSLLHALKGPEREAYEKCNSVSWDKIYCAGDVVDIELAGNRIITFLLDKYIHAVRFPELNYSRLLLAKVPEQYNVAAPSIYGRIQAVLDHVSAMTDVYALDLYRKLNGQTLPAV